ncbi:hypothetical protein EVAR_4213_1 [Eumeta japonica]|uniref:Uncharacterized protein n=1 Tax=Eumeta variegata TaxID=151549 RepID=A0A4C1TG25_EUMVA|nr:hypothetical protein EVAR_4213_1 [Eumeta japonica]
MGPHAGGSPKPTIKITNWNRVSTALEEIHTLSLNSIPVDINTIDEINSAIGALTNRVRTVVGNNVWEVPEFSPPEAFYRCSRIDKSEKRGFAPLERLSYYKVLI